MIKTCQHCGAVNGEPAELCCFCDAPLDRLDRPSLARRVVTTDGNLAVEAEWRREVANRLQDYRARRQSAAAGVQTALPFDSEASIHMESSSAHTPARAMAAAAAAGAAPAPAPAPAKKARAAHAPRAERFEISIPNADIVPGVKRPRPPAAPSAGEAQAQPAMLPVASIPERRRAALVDVGLLLFSYGGMLALFSVLGGRIGFNKLDLAVAGATFALFYAQYFALFTIFGGSTPGMMLRRLRVVSFDGGIPSSRQMAWRSFGYLISAGTCFLGFIWALWDDDQLCWQDRISQTYVTPIEEITPR